MQELYNIMQECIKNPIPKEERDRLNKLYELGPYRQWEIDENAIKRIKEIDDKIHNSYVEAYAGRILRFKGSGGNGKKQLESEYQRLISELENG